MFPVPQVFKIPWSQGAHETLIAMSLNARWVLCPLLSEFLDRLDPRRTRDLGPRAISAIAVPPLAWSSSSLGGKVPSWLHEHGGRDCLAVAPARFIAGVRTMRQAASNGLVVGTGRCREQLGVKVPIRYRHQGPWVPSFPDSRWANTRLMTGATWHLDLKLSGSRPFRVVAPATAVGVQGGKSRIGSSLHSNATSRCH